jgi:hypothetical protein
LTFRCGKELLSQQLILGFWLHLIQSKLRKLNEIFMPNKREKNENSKYSSGKGRKKELSKYIDKVFLKVDLIC